MRLPRVDASPSLATGGAEGRPEDVPGLAENPLLGSWSATRWQYTRRDGSGQVLDLVCDLGGTVTLSLSEGTYVLAYDVLSRGKQSIGGAWRARSDRLDLTAMGSASVDAVRYHLSAETLSLSSEESSWDFDGSGREERALFVAVFVRL